MRRRLLSGLVVAAASFCPIWSGCAEQAEDQAARSSEGTGASAGSSGSSGDGNSTAGSAAAGKAAGGASGSAASPGGTGGVLTNAGAAPVAGRGPSAGGASEGGAGGEGGSGPAVECKVSVDCDDGNPCTTDTCLLQHCGYSSNTTACADDNDPCTADICAVGVCTHPDNKTCACKMDGQCDDKNVCTDDKCTSNQCAHTNNTAACADDAMSCTTDICAGGACTHKDNGGCGVGTPFTVDSFNSDADWTAAKTTPDQRAVVATGADATNLEGNADLYVAESDAASIEFGIASMVGLGKLRVVIRSLQANTGGMVFLGVLSGATWSEKALGTYAAIPTGNYATIEVPTADFGQPLGNLTKVRLRFAVTGGQKSWQIDDISAAK